HVPPRYGSFSMTIVFNPNSPARMAATYPPGPLPIIATSYFATLDLPSAGTRRRVRTRRSAFCAEFGFRSRTSWRVSAHSGGCRKRRFYPNSNGHSPANFKFYQPPLGVANRALPFSLLKKGRLKHREIAVA